MDIFNSCAGAGRLQLGFSFWKMYDASLAKAPGIWSKLTTALHRQLVSQPARVSSHDKQRQKFSVRCYEMKNIMALMKPCFILQCESPGTPFFITPYHMENERNVKRHFL